MLTDSNVFKCLQPITFLCTLLPSIPRVLAPPYTLHRSSNIEHQQYYPVDDGLVEKARMNKNLPFQQSASPLVHDTPKKIPAVFPNWPTLPARRAISRTEPECFFLGPPKITSPSILNPHVLGPAHSNLEELQRTMACTVSNPLRTGQPVPPFHQQYSPVRQFACPARQGPSVQIPSRLSRNVLPPER